MSVPIPHVPARAERRAAAAYEFLLCLILAVIGAVALVHWIELEGLTGAPAAAAAAMGVPRPWLQRLRQGVRAWYLRRRIDAAQQDIQFLEGEARDIPMMIAFYRGYISQLRGELAQVEAGR